MSCRHIVFVLPLTFQVSNTKLAQLRSYEMVNLIISQYFDTLHMWDKVSPQIGDPIYGILHGDQDSLGECVTYQLKKKSIILC